MKNKFYFFGARGRMLCAIALLAAIAFGMAACDSGFGGESTDSRLNGTWGYMGSTVTFNNGNYETAVDEVPDEKGTYTTTGSIITITVTHIYGKGFLATLFEWWAGITLIPNRWYSKADLKALGFPEYDLLDDWFSPSTCSYSISGKTLYFTYDDGGLEVFTKR